MNIYAARGDKVSFAHPKNGYGHDQDKAARHLVKGQTYTIDHTEVHSWHTDVFLQEFPNVSFNSVLFEDAK